MTDAEIHLKSQPLAEANLPAWIRSVQADALRHAAFLADDYDGRGIDSWGYYAQLGDGKITRSDISKAITAAANELDPPKP